MASGSQAPHNGLEGFFENVHFWWSSGYLAWTAVGILALLALLATLRNAAA